MVLTGERQVQILNNLGQFRNNLLHPIPQSDLFSFFLETGLIHNNDLEGFKFVVDHWSDRNSEEAGDLLNKLSEKSLYKMGEYLVRKGIVNINRRNAYRETPLHSAILSQPFGTEKNNYIQFLVAHGADINIRNNRGETPFDIARVMDDEDSINYFTSLMPPVIPDTPLLSRETYSADVNGTITYAENAERFIKRLECPICHENERKVRLNCGHMLCNMCSSDSRVDKCPVCRAPITTRDRVYYNKYLKYKNKYLALKNKL